MGEKKRAFNVGLVIIAFVLILGAGNTYSDYKQLLGDGMVTEGKVYKRQGVAGKRWEFYYSYEVDSIEYVNNFTFSIFSKDEARAFDISKSYYVVYCSKEPELSTLVYQIDYDPVKVVDRADILEKVKWSSVNKGWLK